MTMRPLFGFSTELLGLLLAVLVCNTAGGLASGLAGSLALAASAGLNGLLQVTGLYGNNSLHDNSPYNCII